MVSVDIRPARAEIVNRKVPPIGFPNQIGTRIAVVFGRDMAILPRSGRSRVVNSIVGDQARLLRRAVAISGVRCDDWFQSD